MYNNNHIIDITNMNRTIYIMLPCVYRNITLFEISFEGGQARFWPYFIRELLTISMTPVNQIVVCQCSLCSWLHKINFVRTSQGSVWLIYIEQIGNRWGWNIVDALIGFDTTAILACHINPTLRTALRAIFCCICRWLLQAVVQQSYITSE